MSRFKKMADATIGELHLLSKLRSGDHRLGNLWLRVNCHYPIPKSYIVDLRINETLQTGAVRKPHLPGGESVYLFLEFTIHYLHAIALTLPASIL